MTARELRIGNFILYNTSVLKVTGLGLGIIDTDNISEALLEDNFSPIPLTSEWLEKFGAFKDKGDAWWTIPMPDYREIGTTSIIRYCKGIAFVEQILHQGFTQSKAAEIITEHEMKYGKIQDDDKFGMVMRKNSIQIERSIKYVHQLQNLYFALTGNELTIKTPKAEEWPDHFDFQCGIPSTELEIKDDGKEGKDREATPQDPRLD